MRHLTPLLLAWTLACDDSPETLCAPCEAGEFCVYYGSDVSTEPSTATCQVLPDGCAGCDCLPAALIADEGSGLAWCAEFGCEEVGDTPKVTCPGG